jgi:hypothetical protein
VVALDTTQRPAKAPARSSGWTGWRSGRWLIGTAVVLIVGTIVPLAAAPRQGHVSAAVLTLLLSGAAAAAALAGGSPRLAFLAATAAILVLDLGRLPVRPGPGYEEPEALWRTDQSITASVPVPPAARPELAVLARPVFAGAEPRFGLAASVGDASLSWNCRFQPGVQWLALPLDPAVVPASGSLDVQLRLTGAPSPEQDYLVVYRSARRDGFLVSLGGPDPSAPAPVTTCAAR